MNVESAGARIEQLVAGLEFEEVLEPVTLEDDYLADRRLGVRLRLPTTGWAYQDLTHEALRPIGAVHGWRLDERHIQVHAICPPGEGRDAQWLEDFVAEAANNRLGLILGEPERSTASLDGLPATRIRWKAGETGVDAIVATRDRTLVALVLAGPVDWLEEGMSAVAAGFGFLD